MKEKLKKYKQLNIKLTPQRLAILDYLEGNRMHPSVDQIFKHVSRRFPSMSYATVYNVVNTLVKHNVVKELSIDPDKKRFDPDMHTHHHLICIKCKKIMDIDVDYSINVPEQALDGFTLMGNHIEFYGLCADCRKKDKN
jgi:Fur family peroxide stress response transcriptional regulator